MFAKIMRAAALLSVASATGAWAQDYPTRPVTMVMPFAAGGPGDTIARLIAQGMTPVLKQQVIVENIAGAGGSIGSAKVASASPDGYNLLLIHISHATNPALYPKLKYDPMKDFEPIGLVVDLPSAFVAKKDFPAKDLAELIAHVKANKDKVNYSHAGIGSASHLCGLLFASAIDTKLTQVAYRGTGPAMNDLMGGQVDFMCDQIVNVVSNVEAGTIKGYAVTEHAKGERAAEPAHHGGSRSPGLHLHRVVRAVRSKGNAKADRRQAGRRAQRGAEGQDRQGSARGARCRPCLAGSGPACRARYASQGRDRQVGTRHQGCRRRRRTVTSSKRHVSARM